MLQWSKTYGLEEAIEAIEGAVQPRTVLSWFDGRKSMSGSELALNIKKAQLYARQKVWMQNLKHWNLKRKSWERMQEAEFSE